MKREKITRVNVVSSAKGVVGVRVEVLMRKTYFVLCLKPTSIWSMMNCVNLEF